MVEMIPLIVLLTLLTCVPNDRAQPRCGARRGNSGCTSLFGLAVVFTQANTVSSSSPASYRP